MQRSRRLERQRLLQREYGKQSSKQGWLKGARCGILVEQLQTAVIGCCLPMPSLVSVTVAVPSPAHSLVHCSRSPAAILGVLFCPHLEQNIGSWRRLSGQGHVHAHVHCGLHNRHFTLRENGGSMCGIMYRIRIRCVPWHQCIEITGGRDQDSKLP